MADFLVTTLEDEAFSGSETQASPDGSGLSLREALDLANADPATEDHITFAAELAGGTLRLTQGQLVIAGDTTIDGDLNDDAVPDITIDADGKSGVLRIDNTPLVFDSDHVVPFGETSTTVLTGLVLTGGYAAGGSISPGVPGDGSAIETEVSFFYFGDVTVRDSLITGNTTGPGPSITRGAIGADHTRLQLYGTSVVHNTGTGVSGGDYETRFTLRDSTVSNNTQDGVFIFGYNAHAFIYDSVISDNGGTGFDLNSDNGAHIERTLISGNNDSGITVGIFSFLYVKETEISGNYNPSYGGGIKTPNIGAGPTIEIVDSKIVGNSVAPIANFDPADFGYSSERPTNNTGAGGGIFVGYVSDVQITNTEISGNSAAVGGGVFVSSSPILLTLEDSTVSGNQADFVGGGLAIKEDASIFRTDVSGNNAGDEGGGIFLFPNLPPGGSSGALTLLQNVLVTENSSAAGGGIANTGQHLELENVTITENIASDAGGLHFDVPGAGDSVQTVARNTIIAGNTATAPAGAEDLAGPLVLQGGNIVSDTRFIGATPVQTGFSPALIFSQGTASRPGALLEDPANPALDAGDDTLAPLTDIDGNPRPVDLPGVANNAANASDLGAFEVQGLEPEVHVVVVRAAGTGRPGADPTGNAPIFEVRVDGETIGRQIIENPQPRSSLDTNDDSLFRDYTFSFSGFEADTIEIVYVNDGKIGRLDKNLYVDHMTVDGRTLESEEDGFFLPKNGNPKFGGPTEKLYVNGSLIFDLSDEPTLLTEREDEGLAPIFDFLI